MSVGSLLELYTTIFGWSVYGVLWDIFNQLGLVYYPFLLMLYKNWKEPVLSQDDKEASSTSMTRMQWQGYTMIAVILLAAMPVKELELAELTYAYTCKDSNDDPLTTEYDGDNTGTTYDSLPMIETAVDIPLVWYVVMGLGAGINHVSTSNLPCFEDAKGLDAVLRDIVVSDRKVHSEVSRFYQECFMPALSKYKEGMKDGGAYSGYVTTAWNNGSPVTGQPYEEDDPWYIGSHFFQEIPGFYKTCPVAMREQCGVGFRAEKYVDGWNYNAGRDKDFIQSEIDADKGRPYCDQWWEQPGIGIKDKLLDVSNSVEPDPDGKTVYEQFIEAADGFWFTVTGLVLTETEKEDKVIKNILMSDPPEMTGSTMQTLESRKQDPTSLIAAGGAGAWAGNQTKDSLMANGRKIAAAAGVYASDLAKSLGGFYASMYVIKEAAPMVQAILLMMVYIFLVIYLILSEYDVEAVIQMIFAIVAIKFFTFIWAFADYLDDSLFLAMYPDITILGTIFTLDDKRLILDLITTALYVIGPMILLAVMNAAGKRAGASIAGSGSMLAMGAATPGPRMSRR